MDYAKINEAAMGYKDDMTKFLRDLVRIPGESCGEKGHIIAKVNSLCDKDIIAALYEAAEAGVKIDLIVRGICCVRVGLPGIGDRISVRSIVGNFLEDSRIF